jgi:clan AA aspartic protease (TIGR02281 family)
MQVAELILSPAPNGNFYAKGEINRQAVVFVIDTGASSVSIPDGLRRQLNLARGRYIQSATANGVAGMFETRIASIALGPLRLKNVQAVLNPNASDDTVLLGMTALREIRLIHQNGRMILQQDLNLEATTAEPSPASIVPKLKKPLKDCMRSGNVINDRVLKCMQGREDDASTN